AKPPLFPYTTLFRSEGTELVESEPNDTPEQATQIPVPCAVNGRLWSLREPTRGVSRERHSTGAHETRLPSSGGSGGTTAESSIRSEEHTSELQSLRH